MKRIFTAIDISAAARNEISVYTANLKRAFPNIRVGWEKPEKLHLTLKFLGDTDEAQLKNLANAIEKTAKQFSNFNLQIKDTGVFPSKRNAKILWLDVIDEKGSLRNLQEALEKECEKVGFAREKRNFKPHLTIARLREPHKSFELIARHLENDFQSEEFTISAIKIYESFLQKSGSIYRQIQSSKLIDSKSQTLNLEP